MMVTSVNIGEKKLINYKGRIIETGIFKYPVKSIVLGKEDVESDNVIDRKYHGGIDQAVYAYSENHYSFWKEKYPQLDWHFGMFGENLTMSNFDETEIYVGSQYKLGEAIIEVTKPREPCMKLGIVFETQKILKEFWNSTKSGVYFKVIQEGRVKMGDELTLLSKQENTNSIAEVYKQKRIKKGQ